jgi:hypothetical protein
MGARIFVVSLDRAAAYSPSTRGSRPKSPLMEGTALYYGRRISLVEFNRRHEESGFYRIDSNNTTIMSWIRTGMLRQAVKGQGRPSDRNKCHQCHNRKSCDLPSTNGNDHQFHV